MNDTGGFVSPSEGITVPDGAVKDPEGRWAQLAHLLLASNEFTFLD